MYSAFVLFLIVFFGRETCVSVPSFSSIFYPIGRMYDRGLRGPPPQPSSGQRYHIETLVGITGARMAKYRSTWKEVILAPLKLIWRPHLLGILLFEVLLHFAEILLVWLKKPRPQALLFGFAIGINVSRHLFIVTLRTFSLVFVRSQTLFSLAHRNPRVTGFLNMPSLGHTERHWYMFLSLGTSTA